jgi:energy-converting hydrogenase A subunit R
MINLIKKSFITDCEGPLSLNDNAYEICREFIPDGSEFFRVVSDFDDYLVLSHHENYNAGDTLKLIAPFLKAYGLTNKKIIDFSKKNISLVNGATETMEFAKKNISSYIISTSYGQYIKSLCDEINFPYENTFYTSLNLDIDTNENEKDILFSFKDEIINGDFKKCEEIFFNEIPKLDFYKITENTETVGGIGKKIAIDKIILKENLNPKGIMYIGDSITDVEALRFIRANNGFTISFNGNEFALNTAEIAVISDDTIVNSILLDLFERYNKNYCLEFINLYSDDPQKAFEALRLNFSLMDKFREVFKDKEIPIIQVVTDNNFNFLVEKNKQMREKIRGKEVAELS